MRTVYLLLTEKKIHAYGSWARWIKVQQRADRMGAEHEAMSTEVKSGDPYKSKKAAVDAVRWGDQSRTCESTYARAEAGFADSRGE